ncbi:MAG: hypothetical protein VW972_03005, partial [Flavobacteriaceae bacterium]
SIDFFIENNIVQRVFTKKAQKYYRNGRPHKKRLNISGHLLRKSLDNLVFLTCQFFLWKP